MRDGASHLDDARCSDLVLDLLPPEVRRDALAHASGCPACAARLRSHVGAVNRMRADLPSSGSGRVHRLPTAWTLAPALAAAAALVLLVWWPRGAPKHATGPTTWLAMPAEGVLLREGEAEDPHLAAGFAAYARRDLAAARRELELAHASETTEQARRVYLAHVLFLQGDAAHALGLLRSVDWIQLPAAVHRPAVELLASAERATGHPASADSIQHALQTTPEWIPILP
jgi:hypothetical protein